jgi:hypothetical protein
MKKEFELIKKELRILYNFRYRKIALLVLSIIAAYFIFSNPKVSILMTHIGSWSYLGVFIAGIFFTLGFTSPLSAGFFITLNPENIWLAGILGGLGAMFGDLLIFKFIRFSFMDEFHRLKKTAIMREKIPSGIKSSSTLCTPLQEYLLPRHSLTKQES